MMLKQTLQLFIISANCTVCSAINPLIADRVGLMLRLRAEYYRPIQLRPVAVFIQRT